MQAGRQTRPRILGKLLLVAIMLLAFPNLLQRVRAQSSAIPVRQSLIANPPDSLVIPGELLIRFRENALDYKVLSQSFEKWDAEFPTRAEKSNSAESIGHSDGVRGYPNAERTALLTEHFGIDSENSVIVNSSLRSFLSSSGARYLRRLTAASPIDTESVTRYGDTIGCDHYSWMVLVVDSAENPVQLAYTLSKQFPQDIQFAGACYGGAKLLGSIPADGYFGCEVNAQMINLPTAWNYEVGDDSVVIGIFDFGVDWRHPDLGGALGAGHHVRIAWNYDEEDSNVLASSGHGTPCAGIMAALTNNLLPSPDFSQSVAGIAGGWGTLPPDSIGRGDGASLAILGCDFIGTAEYVAAIFEASAHSTTTPYGFGCHAINNSLSVLYQSYSPLHAAVNYALENGVVFVVARDNGTDSVSYPADYDEPWVVAVAGSIPGKIITPPSTSGVTLDLLAPSGDVHDPCDSGWTLNWTTAAGDTATPPHFGYQPFAGNSAACANVTGAAALLISHFYRESPNLGGIEPEDIQGILKASAWRLDPERLADQSKLNSWMYHSGWGHLDIGKAFEMLDPNLDRFAHSGYQIRHYNFADSLQFGDWFPNKPTGWAFEVPFNLTSVNDASLGKYKDRAYLLSDSGGRFIYAVQYRIVTRTVALPTIWDVSDSAPLFAWGRSGSLDEKSGWSLASENFQTGWSRVADGTGGDSLNEGIFHSQNTNFTIETVQYDVYGFNPASGNYSNHLGHFPPDSMLGVNFTIFGRVDSQFAAVKSAAPKSEESLQVSLDRNVQCLSATIYSRHSIENPVLAVYDALGRSIADRSQPMLNSGWNTFRFSIANLPSGIYLCRLTGANLSEAKPFTIIR